MRQCAIPGVGVFVDGAHHHVAAEQGRDFFYTQVMPLLKDE
jgi:hypothetical protein